jgi:hypothetical protein
LPSGSGIPTQCGFTKHEKNFGVGTSGNEAAGRTEQGSVTRICYSYEYCNLTGPWVDGLPVAERIYYICETSTASSGMATASSFEPTGADCVLP